MKDEFPDKLPNQRAVSLPKPELNQLIDALIRLFPREAKSNPAMAIDAVVKLFMRGGIALENWDKATSQFVRGELLRQEKPLRADSQDKLNTFGHWLNSNATEARDKIKSPSRLIEIILDLAELGVTTAKWSSSPNDPTFEIEVLKYGEVVFSPPVNRMYRLTTVWLSQDQARDFLRLRKLQRETPELQKGYRAWLATLSPSKKIAAVKTGVLLREGRLASFPYRDSAEK